MSTDKQPSAPTDSKQISRRDPADLAPSVDRDWANEFILELRMLDVPGQRIGDALVTVEAHVRDSGEPVGEAFGDAIAYARQLARDEPARATPISARTVIAAVLGLAGMLTLPDALNAWFDGTTATISAGQLAVGGLALLVLLAFTVAAAADRLLRQLLRRPWIAIPASVFFVFVSVWLLVALPAVVAEVPPLLLSGVGVLLIVTSTALSWRDLSADDSVLALGEQPPRRPIGRRAQALVIPGFALVILAFTWVMHLLM